MDFRFFEFEEYSSKKRYVLYRCGPRSIVPTRGQWVSLNLQKYSRSRRLQRVNVFETVKTTAHQLFQEKVHLSELDSLLVPQALSPMKLPLPRWEKHCS